MTPFLLALVAGAVAALIAGSVSGIIIGGEAIGREVAGAMGAIYGVLSGGAEALIGLIILNIIQGAV